jgi:hypothetical protein
MSWRKQVDYRGFEPRSGPTKDDKIGMCSFSAKNATYIYIERAKTGWLMNEQLEMLPNLICILYEYCTIVAFFIEENKNSFARSK